MPFGGERPQTRGKALEYPVGHIDFAKQSIMRYTLPVKSAATEKRHDLAVKYERR